MWRELKFFSNLDEKSNGGLFWNGLFFQPLGEKRINVENDEHDITRNIQKNFTDTKLTTKCLNNNEKETVFDILNNVGFCDMKHTKCLHSAERKLLCIV